MGSGSHRDYYRAKALLLMSVYMRVKETIHIAQIVIRRRRKNPPDFYSFSRPDIDFGVAGGKQK